MCVFYLKRLLFLFSVFAIFFVCLILIHKLLRAGGTLAKNIPFSDRFGFCVCVFVSVGCLSICQSAVREVVVCFAVSMVALGAVVVVVWLRSLRLFFSRECRCIGVFQGGEGECVYIYKY